MPWTLSGATIVTESPFVKVFTNFGLGYAATVMNFVILSAALSSTERNLYLCTRMIFSLSRSGHAPAALGKVNARGTPLRAAVLSTCGVLIAAMTAYASRKAYNYPVRHCPIRLDPDLAHHSRDPFAVSPPSTLPKLAQLSSRAPFRLTCRVSPAAPGRDSDHDGARHPNSGTSRSSWVCPGSSS